MRFRSAVGVLVSAAALALPGAAPASSAGTREQIAWVRRAAAKFVRAELRGDGAGACSVLTAQLRATQRRKTCAQRWNARLARLVREPGGRARLGAEARAIPSAAVVVRGYSATIRLPAPLLSGRDRFLWTENCWMLEG
jgi:hypothetical protein